MGQIVELIVILPLGKVRLFTLLVIPSLLASATICGIGELTDAFVLVTTGLTRIFLLLVMTAWLFSVLQNRLLSFYTRNTSLCKFFKYFLPLFHLCSHLCLPKRPGVGPKPCTKNEI